MESKAKKKTPKQQQQSSNFNVTANGSEFQSFVRARSRPMEDTKRTKRGHLRHRTVKQRHWCFGCGDFFFAFY